jgi:propionate CoA-transferase
MNPRVPEWVSAKEAVSTIADGATVLVTGFASCGLAVSLHEALRDRYREEQHPRGITYIHAAGHYPNAGMELLLEEGLLGRLIGAHWGRMRKMTEVIPMMRAEVHNWPQGVVVSAVRSAARGETQGYITRIGLGTFVDPDIEGGCVNEAAKRAGSLIQKIEVLGQPMLCFPMIEPDVVLTRGWSVDRNGNVSCRKEAFSMSQYHFSLAARRCGGKVICQVREKEDRVFAPHEIDLPAFLVDMLVLAECPEQQHRQSVGYDYNPALNGEGGRVEETLPPVPDGLRGWIGRRAAMEVRAGELLNLGIGIPGDTVGAALVEQKRADTIISTMESGLMGGTSVGRVDFGTALYPDYRIDPDRMFDLYYGGNLDIAIMGAAEIDGSGNINVSSFGGRTVGCGGFIDIAQSARRVVFCSPLTVGGLDVVFEDGKVKILQEGTTRKMVKRIQQITFSARTARELKQEVMLVTERAVFRLGHLEWELIEIAPGLEIEQHVTPFVEFPFSISPDCRTMPIECFTGKYPEDVDYAQVSVECLS